MAHPLMFDEADALLRRVRELALALPDAAEKVSHGRPAFYTGKVFTWYGGSVRANGVWVQHDQSILVLTDPDERLSLEQEPRGFAPAYLGPRGWIGVDLDHRTDWVEIAELIETSYRLTAGVRRVARLEDQRRGVQRGEGRQTPG